MIQRRQLLTAAAVAPLAALAACASPLPISLDSESTPAARARLAASADAHGWAGFASLHDVNVRYEGEWRALVDRLQPALVDAGFRQSSEERLLVHDGAIGQAYRGPSGTKQVLRRGGTPGEVHVWFNTEEARDAERLQAAALVADAYRLFLLGPLALMADGPRVQALTLADTDWVEDHECDVLQGRLAPGIGRSAVDRIAIYIDRRDSLLRRLRFTLDGLESTQGAIAEVEMYDHASRFGFVWPTRFYERIKRPIANLPAHDWRLLGLDVNRGYDADAIVGPVFAGAAAAPAAALAATG